MIFILDGPDGAGKTTLANYLSSQLGFPIKHRSKPNTQEEKLAMMKSYLQDIHVPDNLIWDRCFYSEMVYGPIMRDKSYISLDQMYSLESELANIGALVCYCTGDILKLWDRCSARGETYIKDIDILAEIVDKYDTLMLKTKHLIPIVKYEVGYGQLPTLRL